MAAELFGLAAAFGALGLHPFITYPASLLVLRKFRPRPLRATAPEGKPRIALCVCAYNEEHIISAKIENMLSLRRTVPDLELLLYVDAATDKTALIANQYADLVRLYVSPTRHGKSFGMNLMVAATDADIVVFSDANVIFADDAIVRLVEPFLDREIGCVCGHLIYKRTDGSATAATGSLYWRLEEAIKELESQTGSTMGADGSIFAIRRALHTPPPADIIDDMFVSLSILCDGYRVVRAADAIAFEETVSQPHEEFRRKVRISCQAFNVHRLIAGRLWRMPVLDRYKYVSHKLLRWMSGYLLTACGITLFGALLASGLNWGAVILAGLVCATTVAGLWAPKSFAGKLLEIALALAATALGIIRSVSGERFQTWTPPSSARSGR